MKKISTLLLIVLLLTISGITYANKTSVKVSVPAKIKMGSQIIITINVTHKGNTAGHHTDWVYLKINGKEVKRWTYNKSNLPSDGNFILTYTYTVTEKTLNIEAEGDCNIHGTAGPDKVAKKIGQ